MRKGIAVGALVTAGVAAASVAAFAAHGSSIGSSSSQSPYLVPSTDGVDIQSIFTVGDPVGGAVDGYRMIGIPDGLGAFKSKDGTFMLLMNHEIPSTAPGPGATRAHGANGAFVSQWSIRPGRPLGALG